MHHQSIFPDQLNRAIGASVEKIIIDELGIINDENRPVFVTQQAIPPPTRTIEYSPAE